MHSARSGWHVASQPAAQLVISSAKLRTLLQYARRSSGNIRMMRAKCSRSHLASFLFEQRAHRALIDRWFERVNEIAKPFGENFRPKFPVMSHARRDDIMSKESVPALPRGPCPSFRKHDENGWSQTLSRIGKQHGKIAPALRLRVH